MLFRSTLNDERAKRFALEREFDVLCDQIKEHQEEARRTQRRYEVVRGEAEVFKASNTKLEEQL